MKTNQGTNAPPIFTDTTEQERTRSVEENTPSGRNVGTAVTADDDSSTTLTYSLGGRDAALFTIVSTSGQSPDEIGFELTRTRRAATIVRPNQTTCTYTVRVKVDDRAGGSHSIVVTISVTGRE